MNPVPATGFKPPDVSARPETCGIRPSETLNDNPASALRRSNAVAIPNGLQAPLLTSIRLPSVSITLSHRASAAVGSNSFHSPLSSRNALGLGCLASIPQSSGERIVFAHSMALRESPKLQGIAEVFGNSLWRRAPTASLELSCISHHNTSGDNSVESQLAPSLLSVQKYFEDRPIIRMARRETFCLAGPAKDAPVDRLLRGDSIFLSKRREDIRGPSPPHSPSTTAEAAEAADAADAADAAALPLRSNAFLAFMIDSGQIGRKKRSKHGRGISNPSQ